MRISDWSSDVCSSDLGVKNRADPDTALRIILKGTGLTYQRDGNIFVVKAVGNASQAAPAASANDYGDEIVVTAQKKVESIQDVPISVSAFSAKSLDEQKIEGGSEQVNRKRVEEGKRVSERVE